MPIGISPIIYPPDAGGLPSTSGVAQQMQGRIDSYTHTITATGGFESCTLPFVGTFEEAVFWLNQLMSSVAVYGPDAESVWGGYVSEISVTLGQERRSISLDKMANRVKTRYTSLLGTPRSTTPIANDASIARYGTKDGVIGIPESTSTAASNFAVAELARTAWPLASPSTEIATGSLGDIKIELHCTGWYYVLDWLLTKVTTRSSAVTTDQVQALITAYNATNPFLSTVYHNIIASGISDTQYVAADTTFRQAIENLLKQGNSNGQRLAWGVYEDRKMRVQEWAGANPTVIGYRRNLGRGQITNGYGSTVNPWNVRPDAMYEVMDLLDAAPVVGNADAAARFYVERVTCKIDSGGVGVTLEPQSGDSLDARLARLG